MIKDLFLGKGLIMLHPSIFYFIQFAAIACLNPFLSLMLADRSLSKLQIGIVVSVIPLAKFIGSPMGSFIYDRSNESKIVWISVVIGTAISIQFLQITSNIYFIGLICAIWSFIQSPMTAISNHSVLTFLGENKKDYGKYRLWGAVSWGIVSFLIGIIITYYPLYASYISYAIGLFIYGCYIFITKFKKTTKEHSEMLNNDETIEDDQEQLLSDSDNEIELQSNFENSSPHVEIHMEEENNEKLLPDDEKWIKLEEDHDHPKLEANSLVHVSAIKTIFNICLHRDVFIFYLVVFMMGVGTTVIYIYLFIYLQEDLHASETLMGISIVCTVSTEIPFFFYSGKFLDWFGEEWLILSALIAYIVRVIGYSFLQNPWFVLPLELLHGLTFGAMYAAGIHYSSNLFPAHLSTTGQGIFNGIYAGLGPTCGSLMGGYLYYAYGARIMYRVMAAFVTVAALIHCLNFGKLLFMRAKLLFKRITTKIEIDLENQSLEIELEELEDK